MGMFDSIRCNYPLPLPLEVIDILPDIYEQEFQTKDLDNLMNEYVLAEDGQLWFYARTYKYVKAEKDDSLLPGYLEKETEKLVPENFHGYINLYCYEDVYESPSSDKCITVSIDYVAKFTDGKLENIEILEYSVTDGTDKVVRLKNLLDEWENKSKRWYNKYIFRTKIYQFFKRKIILPPLDLLRKFSDKLYFLAVRYL